MLLRRDEDRRRRLKESTLQRGFPQVLVGQRPTADQHEIGVACQLAELRIRPGKFGKETFHLEGNALRFQQHLGFFDAFVELGDIALALLEPCRRDHLVISADRRRSRQRRHRDVKMRFGLPADLHRGANILLGLIDPDDIQYCLERHDPSPLSFGWDKLTTLHDARFDQHQDRGTRP
ncbi:hypothetical protein [Rhizobium binxianense]